MPHDPAKVCERHIRLEEHRDAVFAPSLCLSAGMGSTQHVLGFGGRQTRTRKEAGEECPKEEWTLGSTSGCY